MYKVETGQSLCRYIKLFYKFGVWRDEEESSLRQLGRKLCFLINYILFVIFIVISALISGDRSQLIFLMEIAICTAVVTIKLAYLLWRKDEILAFLYDPIVSHSTVTLDESVEVKQKIKKILKFFYVYSVVIFVNVPILITVTLPIFTSEKKLPLFIRFEWESEYATIFYWITCAYLAWCIFACFLFNCMMLFIWYIMFNYAIEYKLLGNQFRRLGHTTENKKGAKKVTQTEKRNLFQKDLIGLIRAHKNLSETVERFRSCFSALFLAEIVTGGISICVSTFNLAYNSRENIFEMAFLLAGMFYAFFDIFLVMYLANEITAESDRLSYCLFESNWIEQSQSTKKCIIILGEMLKQPQQLVILIYPMNLEKFTSIVNGAYSMFNVLKSFK